MTPDPITSLDIPEFQERLAGDALVLGVLGKILYTYPDRHWLQSLVDGGIFDDVPFEPDHPSGVEGLEVLRTWSKACADGISDEIFDALRSDYTRLFIGPGQPLAPPWESVHVNITGLTFQEETLDVRRWYARADLEFEKIHNEPDDHIGIELAFISHLATRAIDSLADESPDYSRNPLDLLYDFAKQHICAWAPAWCRKSAVLAETDLYKGTLKMTEGCLTDLAELLNIELVEILN
jgi:TorA maturation chaperone TorD